MIGRRRDPARARGLPPRRALREAPREAEAVGMIASPPGRDRRRPRGLDPGPSRGAPERVGRHGRRTSRPASRRSALLLVAELDGELVGQRLRRPLRHPRPVRSRPACCPESRRRGVGTALLRALLELVERSSVVRGQRARRRRGLESVRRALRLRGGRPAGRAGEDARRRDAATRPAGDRGRDDRRAAGAARGGVSARSARATPTSRLDAGRASRSTTGCRDEATLPDGSFVALADG